jgi:hypothetical protein
MGWTHDAIAFHELHQVSIGQPIRPEEIVGAWLRECGDTKQQALQQLVTCQQELERLKTSRQQEVQFRQELAGLLGEKYPAPQKILMAVKKLVGQV